MSNRRDFLKVAATGAVVLGSQSKFALAGMLDPQAEAGKSRVVVARDAALHGPAGSTTSKPDEKRVLALLDRAIASYTGLDNPVEAWKRIVPAGKVIGLKTNGLGGRGISTHAVLAMAIAERLQQAGVKAGNIIVWDRNARDLEVCGLTINTDPSKVRCFGSDVSGYEDQPVAFGSVSVKLSKILTRECDMVIGLPILKDHELAGVTFAMKNMYGVIQKPWEIHANGCNPAVADLNRIPVIREKCASPSATPCLRFTTAVPASVRAAVVSQCAHCGRRPRGCGPHRLATDRAQARRGRRAYTGDRGPSARYIATAADAAHQLGVNDPARIHLMEV